MSLRDPEFAEIYQHFLITSGLNDQNLLPKEKVLFMASSRSRGIMTRYAEASSRNNSVCTGVPIFSSQAEPQIAALVLPPVE